jgi:hypothetical protein
MIQTQLARFSVLLGTVLAAQATIPDRGAVDGCSIAPGPRTTKRLAVQGIGLQGVGLQGIGLQGIGRQGLGSQGLGQQGVGRQGIGYQGFGPQGLGQQGFGQQGIGYQGFGRRGSESWAMSLADRLPAAVELHDGALVAMAETGLSLKDQQLVGLSLPMVTDEGDTQWLTIASSELAGDDHDVGLYALELDGKNVCGTNGKGLFVSGAWDQSGRHVDQLTVGNQTVTNTFSCTSGVIAKCVLWGYRPWAVGASLHQACTRMARADYCGDGAPHTENGTTIDMFDRYGLQAPANAPHLSFEAGWAEDGAVCVNEPRYDCHGPQAERELPSCWDSKPRCSSWGEAVAYGAELGNDSAHTVRNRTMQESTACR